MGDLSSALAGLLPKVYSAVPGTEPQRGSTEDKDPLCSARLTLGNDFPSLLLRSRELFLEAS